MESFYQNFIEPQNVAPDSRLFSSEHIIVSTLSVFFIFCLFSLQMKHCDEKYSKKILKKSSILMIILEVFRISWITYFYGFSLKNIRYDWCNQICLSLPFIVLFENKVLYPFIDILSFIGGAGVIAYPVWVFYDYAGLHIMSLQSMISHTLMVIIPMSMSFVSKHWDYEKNIKKPFIGFLFMAVVAFFMSRCLDTNYMIMKSADGIPILKNFSFPYYWLIALPCLLIVLNVIRLIFIEIRKKILDRENAISIAYENSSENEEKIHASIGI